MDGLAGKHTSSDNMSITVKQVVYELYKDIPAELHHPLVRVGGEINGSCVTLYAARHLWGSETPEFQFDLSDPVGFSKATEWLRGVLIDALV